MQSQPSTEIASPRPILNVFSFMKNRMNPWLLDGEGFHYSAASASRASTGASRAAILVNSSSAASRSSAISAAMTSGAGSGHSASN
jgi:hypothetical protein